MSNLEWALIFVLVIVGSGSWIYRKRGKDDGL